MKYTLDEIAKAVDWTLAHQAYKQFEGRIDHHLLKARLEGTQPETGPMAPARYDTSGLFDPNGRPAVPVVPPQGRVHWDWCARTNTRGANAKCNCGGPEARKGAGLV